MNIHRWERFFRMFIPIYVSGYYIWLIYWRDNEQIRTLGGDIFSTFSPLLTFVILFLTMKRSVGIDKKFWLLMSGSALFFTAAELVWDYYELILRVTVPYPGLPDLFYILSPIFELAAIVFIVYKDSSLRNWRALFDALITMTVGATLCWAFMIKPVLSQGEVPFLELVVSTFYPVTSLGLFFGMVGLFSSNKPFFHKNVANWLVLALFIRIFADCSYTYLTLYDLYYSGTFYDPLWSLSFFCYSLAAFNYKEAQATEDEQNQKPDMAVIYKGTYLLKLAVPYISVSVLFVIMISRINQIDSIVIGSAVSLILVIIRQLLTLIENESLVKRLSFLNKALEDKVRERTEELFEKNRQLTTVLKNAEYMAYHDSLTNLPNRRFFEEKLVKSIEQVKKHDNKLAVFFFDFDRFKNINDSLGHAFGDVLLCKAAERMLGCLKEKAVISRLGGDEFTIILEEMQHHDEALTLANKIKQTISQPFIINNQEIHITTSIGISIYPDHGHRAEDLIKYADTAMYCAKETGKNNIQFYTQEMNESVSKKVTLEAALRKAIEKEEFSIYYQPQIHIQSNELIGVEALIRWNVPKLGAVPPAEFIPFAEETGLIVPIGEWVLKTSCQQLKLWHDQGFESLKLSVNLSSLQFQSENLVELIEEVIEDTRINPAFLELEVTESVAMFNEEQVINQLHELKKRGISIAIDDFGTGYSSLSYLKKFPVDTLKIDQSFIRDVLTNDSDRALVSGIISMAQSMNFKVIAEGVETHQHLSHLVALKCDGAQGYLFSKPLPTNDVQDWMKQYIKQHLQVENHGVSN
ncbi:putative bifunctional diguanylate cyclase/phosphodiesterase [Priestia abyssalis]|uniref:putative bifunctional diguanylate cyclase/phosphodiesterase n=1 Tax=Priestia abyssalis TaxID=1221450 RepID=UPI0009956C98|nr:EAL domain-containing protein [Priestia abyssalis]